MFVQRIGLGAQFGIQITDSIRYFSWLVNEANQRGLTAVLKNTFEVPQVSKSIWML